MKKLVAVIGIFMIIILTGVSAPAIAANKDIVAKKDIVAPSITNTYPKNNEKDIMVESTIIIRFDEKIQKGKSIAKIVLSNSTSKSIAFTYELKDNILMIIPKEKLKFGTEYKLTIPAATVKDGVGLALSKQFQLSFTTEKSLNIDSSDLGVISDTSEEDTSDVDDPAANDDTVNITLEMEAYVADSNFSEEDKTNAMKALKKVGVYVRSVTSEIQIPEDTKTYDVVLERVVDYNIDRYLQSILYLDGFEIDAIIRSVPSVIAEDLSRSEAEYIKFNAFINGGEASVVEHVPEPEVVYSDAYNADSYDVELVSISGSKYPVLKIFKEELDMSLDEAFHYVYTIPVSVPDVSPEVAQALKFRLEWYGAVVNVTEHED